MPLRYAPFAASTAVVQAAKNAPPLKSGAKGAGVALLQGALIDRNYKLPLSTRKGGVPDGLFGHETYLQVFAFQRDNSLKTDGVAGAKTIEKLDALMAAAAPPAPHVPPPAQPPPPVTAEYKLGTDDPRVTPDPGAGKWNSVPTQVTYMALKGSILEILPAAYFTIGHDATKHMQHYMDNSGKDYTIDLEGMVREVSTARKRFEDEVSQARKFVELLPPGTQSFTSQRANGGYNRKSENQNWYYAIGGYSTWGKGVATVVDGPSGREYVVDFEYKFFDRYNWDGGKSVTIGGITVTDKFMGEFHREGIAQEFDCYGSFKRKLSWRKGEPIPKTQLDGAGGR